MTNVGNVRELNEDAYLDAPGIGLWAVADGMGGHHAGDVASQMIVRELGALDAADDAATLVDQLEHSLQAINQRLFTMSGEDGAPSIIGSTVAVMAAHGAECICLWAGDSRVYRLRNFELCQMTTDHSEVEFLIAERGLSRQDAERHPDANVITRAVGGDESLVLDTVRDTVRTRDRYLLCSDGLTRALSAPDIARVLSEGSCTDACRTLVGEALSGDCADNVTVVTVDFEELE
jgi:serine/threonine protein phosphatase PrpC